MDVTTAQSPKPDKYDRKKILTIGLAVIGLIAVALIIWYAFGNSKFSDYKYGKLTEYKIPGFTANTGMSFKVPIELDPVSELVHGQYAQRFGDNKQVPNGKYITLSYESAGIGYAPRQSGAAQKAVLKQVSDAINDASNKNHKAYLDTLQTFVKNNTSSRWTMNFKPVKPLTTANLKSSTWAMDFSGKDPKPISSYTPTRLTGEMVYSVTNGNYYYFLIASVDNNWKHNQQVWQDIIDSLKVDQ